ncbi:unnamed protein product [Pedinophyceae sp. YPF-701]|nr:unnamed protein product [Pedinophyceae sp. YPF-701]
MDGTLTVSNIDFKTMREDVAIPEGDLFTVMESWDDEERIAKAMERILELEAEAQGTLKPMPGLEELLRWCKSSGLKVAVVTRNTPTAVATFLALLPDDLRDCFDTIITRHHRWVKPDYRLLVGLAEEWGAPLPALLMVGDSTEDVEVGNAAGTATALIAGGGNEVGGAQPPPGAIPTVRVESLTDLLQQLQEGRIAQGWGRPGTPEGMASLSASIDEDGPEAAAGAAPGAPAPGVDFLEALYNRGAIRTAAASFPRMGAAAGGLQASVDQDGDRVLHLACGAGPLTKLLASQGLEAVGVDADVAAATKRGLCCAQYDGEPLGDLALEGAMRVGPSAAGGPAPVDAVVLYAAAADVRGRELAGLLVSGAGVAEVARVLAPGGTLCLQAPLTREEEAALVGAVEGRGLEVRRRERVGAAGTELRLVAQASGGEGRKRKGTEPRVKGTVVERSAFDVAVLGDTAEAYLCAYRLAKSGRDVVMIERPFPGCPPDSSLGPSHRCVHIPNLDPVLAHLGQEALPVWKTLTSTSKAIAREIPSVDIGMGSPPLGGFGGAPGVMGGVAEDLGGIEGLMDVCTTAGVPVSLLTPGQAAERFASLSKVAKGHLCLLNESGLVVDVAAAKQAARARAVRAGAVAEADRELLGWEDCRSTFRLRVAAPGANEEAHFEVEQVVIAAGSLSHSVMSGFGDSIAHTVSADVLPRAAVRSPELPVPRSLVMYHDPWGYIPLMARDVDPNETSRASSLRKQVGSVYGSPSGRGSTESRNPALIESARKEAPSDQPGTPDIPHTMYGWYMSPNPRGSSLCGLLERPFGGGNPGSRGNATGADWLTDEVYSSTMGIMMRHASTTVRGFPPEHSHKSRRMQVALISPDGRPLVAPHPLLEELRVVSIVPCQAPASPPGTSFHVSPLLGEMAARMVLGGTMGVTMHRVLGRERRGLETALENEPVLPPYDAWGTYGTRVSEGAKAMIALARAGRGGSTLDSMSSDTEGSGRSLDVWLGM